MNRRFRFVGALLALSALSASYAETLWASTTCTDADVMTGEAMASMAGVAAAAGDPMAGMDSEAMAAMGQMDPDGPGDAEGASRHSMPPPAATAPHDQHSTDNAPRSMADCPLIAVAGTCAAASFPPSEPRIHFGSVSRCSSRPATDAGPMQLFRHSLLRPPIA